MFQLFQWLDGKKTYIIGFLSLTNAFLGTQKVYDQNTMAYIQAVLTLLAGGAEFATVKFGSRQPFTDPSEKKE